MSVGASLDISGSLGPPNYRRGEIAYEAHSAVAHVRVAIEIVSQSVTLSLSIYTCLVKGSKSGEDRRKEGRNDEMKWGSVLAASSEEQPTITQTSTSPKKVVSAQRQATSVEAQEELAKLSSKQVTCFTSHSSQLVF
jgi:hypothetical protein